jgi:hypothetical protein
VHWPIFEACLATYMSLLLQKVSQGVGVVLIGDSGAGKGTILESFQSAPVTVWRDKFTPKSLLSGFAGEGSTRKAVNDRALFRAVRHRALVVGDLGPIMQGGEDQAALYSVIPPWFDGGGLVFDTGAHGMIGGKGDFSFVMLGGKTPFDMPTWHAMSTVGPRFLFLRVARLDREERVPARMYDDAKREVRQAITDFLRWVFERHQPRSMDRPMLGEEREAQLSLYAQIMADGQTMRPRSGWEIVRPTSNHLLQRLAIVLYGHALLWRRDEIGDAQLALAKRFARHSTPGQRGRVLLALTEGLQEVGAIAEHCGISYDAVRRTLEQLESVEVVIRSGLRPAGGRGQPAQLWKRAPEPPDPEREALRAEEGT